MKKTRIIIISLIVVIVLGCATFATLYFATDLFKSDKELFYKNISQMDLSKITDTAEITKYQERLKSEKFKNEGSLSIGANIGEEININESFKYISQVDNANKLADSSVTINKEGNDLLTINYLRNEDLYGLQLEKIVSQYIAVKNDNLKEFAQKLGIQDVTEIPDKIDLDEITQNLNQEQISLEDINLEEIKLIVNKYLDIIIESIPETSYSKVEGGYKLTIDLKTIQNVLIEVIKNLKDDEQVFNLVNSIISKVDSSMQLDFEEYQEDLQEGIDELSVEVGENFNIVEIIAYNEGKVYFKMGIDSEEGKSYIDGYIKQNDNKIVLELNKVTKASYQDEEMKININKNIDTTEKDLCEIEIIIKEDEEEIGNFSFEITREGNLESNNIANSILASFVLPEEELEISIDYNNNTTFDPSIEIEEITSSNLAVINDLDYTQISNLVTNLSNLVTQKTGVSPIELIGGAGIGVISTIAIDSQELAKAGRTIGILGLNITIYKSNLIIDRAKTAAQETQSSMENQAVEVFNSQFLGYEGLQRGSTVKMLLQAITSSNSRNPENLIGYTNIDEEDIEPSKIYNITFQKDFEGYIYKVNIEEQ